VDLLKDEFVGALADAALDRAARDFNLDVRGAGDLDGEALHTLVETPPMLADRRLVVVHGIEQWRKNGKVWEVLTRYLGHPAPSTVLVLIHSGDEAPDPRATTGATHVEVGPLTSDQAARWLQRRASHIGLGLSPEAAQHLLAAVGNDLGTLAQELAKLAAALPEGAPVAVADVAALVGVRRGETVADWVQAILRRDQQGAIALLEVVLRQGSVTGVQLVMTLGTHLVGARLARALMDTGTPAGRLRAVVFDRLKAARPAGVGRWSEVAAAWSDAAGLWRSDELDEAIAAAGTADRRLKSTTISDEGGVLLTMLLALPRPRAAA
jgi:DNA polymerase-3 subunit delta